MGYVFFINKTGEANKFVSVNVPRLLLGYVVHRFVIIIIIII